MRNRKEAEKKAKSLVSEMTLEEKASQLKYDAPAIHSLNIPAYNWWNEGLHGVARAGTATVFPQAIGLAAMFDEQLLTEVADVVATEARAKFNAYSEEGDRDIYKGLTLWSPNVNIFRDPRWGRGHETYGEDPFLTSRLGVAFINGLQGDGEYLKTAACAKHYAVHSGPEAIRHEFNAEATPKDMWETYLPAFEACVKEGQVEAVMGAYNRTNGEPCCGSTTLIKDILRGKWNYQGHFVSDCWAIKDFHEHHGVTSNAVESASMAINAGCDLNCGNMYLNILRAHQQGLVSEETITRSAERLFTSRYLLGLFDKTEYDQIPYDVVECKEHRALAKKAAQKSIVLLKNDGLLPLSQKLKAIGVIGPNANSRAALIGNYHGTSSRYTTVLEGIQNAVGEEVTVHYSEGSHLFKDRVEHLAWPNDRISEAAIAAKNSDIVVLCLGLDETLEGEEGDTGNSYASGDKMDLNLPKAQEQLLKKVAEVGKPVILCLMAGSAIDLSFAKDHPNIKAILQLWYPGAEGGTAAADIIFGKVSPSGKLPVTFYNSLESLPAFEDYSMKGRTYRYIEEKAQYPFGYGLTYSKVELSDAEITVPELSGKTIEEISKENIGISVEISNVGTFDTDEVIQLYLRDCKSKYAVRNHSLCGFKRVSLPKGTTQKVQLTISGKALLAVNDAGERILGSNEFKLFIGVSQPDEESMALCGVRPIEIPIILD